MKYSVRFAGLTACDESLKQASGRQGHAVSQLDQVIRRLDSMSGFRQITGSLRSQKRTMETEQSKLTVMAETIRQVRNIYLEAENRTVERAECPNFLSPHMLFPPLSELRQAVEPDGRNDAAQTGPAPSESPFVVNIQITRDGVLVLVFEGLNALLRSMGLRIELSGP